MAFKSVSKFQWTHLPLPKKRKDQTKTHMRTSTSVALSMCASASERPVVCVQVRLNVIINPKKATNWNPAPAHKNEIYFCNRIVKPRVCHTKSTLHDSSVATRKTCFSLQHTKSVLSPTQARNFLHDFDIWSDGETEVLRVYIYIIHILCTHLHLYTYERIIIYTHIHTSTSIHLYTYRHMHIYTHYTCNTYSI